MTSPYVMSSSRAFPVPVEAAFDRVLATPLETVFDRRYGVIPPIRGSESAESGWGTVGQTRKITLSDGGTMREELTVVDRPRQFCYRITEVTGAMKLLVSSVDGQWSFAEAGTGVRITWQWTLHPTGAAAGVALPVFARMWQGYARQALENLEGLLLER